MTKYHQTFDCEKNKSKSFLQLSFHKVLIVFVAVMLVGSSFVYLIQINQIAAKGFELKKLEQEIGFLSQENEKLSLEVIELQSMANLKERIEKIGMVPVDKISYLDVSTSLVAAR